MPVAVKPVTYELRPLGLAAGTWNSVPGRRTYRSRILLPVALALWYYRYYLLYLSGQATLAIDSLSTTEYW